jgi:hypothetical protein
MKRVILILIATTISIFHADAQRFKVGITAGVDISDVDGTDLTDADDDFNKFGFTLGTYVNTRLNDRSMVQMEIAWAQKGSSQPPDSTNNNFYYKLQLNYVDVTLVYRHSLQFNVDKKPTTKFEFEAGASLGYLFNYSYAVQSILYPINLNTTDVSALVGLVYNFSPSFCLDVRYSNSIIPVIKPDAVNNYFLYYGSWNRGHNLVFQISFKYTFGNGGETATTDQGS